MNVNLASIDILKSFNVQIGIITDKNTISTETLKSLLQWTNTATMIGIKWNLITMQSNQNAALMRNCLAAQFLEIPAATHLLFLGEHIGFEPHQILQLLSAEKHIIGGMVPKSVIPVDFHIDRTDDMVIEDGLLEVNSLDFDFTLMNKESFSHLAKSKAVLPYKDASGALQNTFFKQDIINGQYETDVDVLGINWQNLGGKLWLHSDVYVTKSAGHIFQHK